MNDIKPEQTLNRRLVHGKISRGLCLEARDRIEELEAQVANFESDAYVLSLLTKIDELESER